MAAMARKKRNFEVVVRDDQFMMRLYDDPGKPMTDRQRVLTLRIRAVIRDWFLEGGNSTEVPSGD
jgi:hypothetical protein